VGWVVNGPPNQLRIQRRPLVGFGQEQDRLSTALRPCARTGAPSTPLQSPASARKPTG